MDVTTTRTANNENFVPPKDITNNKMIDNNPHQPTNRRVLGDVSPNVKHAGNVFGSHNRPLTGSPLKRSFTAMVEQNDGLTYLKRRRVSHDDMEDRPIDRVASASRRVFDDGENSTSMSIPSDETIEAPVTLTPDNNNASPTEVNSSASNSDDQPSSTGRKSFSSLINYDHSSQTSNILSTSITKAELLMLRLRVAMYKVRTNQVDIPFGDLRVDGPNSLKQSTSAAVEEAVAALRREAQSLNSPATTASVPQLLPAPVLKPTKYSSRMIYERAPPSSPPVAYSQTSHLESDGSSTPRPRDRLAFTSPFQPIEILSRESNVGMDVSSVEVQGKVAEGLLEMRNACR